MNFLDCSTISPQMVAAATRTLEAQAWVAGGWVRDRLLRRKSIDADIVVAGRAEFAARAAARLLGGSFVVLDRIRHIYRVALPAVHVDFTAMRGHDIEEDLRSRDFTVNAVALPCSRVVHRLWRAHIIDPARGIRDIENRVVRHTSPCVFEEDPLRTLRAIRLAASLRFSINRPTQKAIKQHAHHVSRVAAERIRDELFPILRSRQVHLHLAMAQRLGLIDQILPETQSLLGLSQGSHHRLDAWGHTLEAVRHLNRLLDFPGSWAGPFAPQVCSVLNSPTSADRSRADVVRFACLLHDAGKPATLSLDERGIHFYGHGSMGAELAGAAARRMRLSRQETAAVRTIVENHMRPLLLAGDVVTDRALMRLAADAGDRCVELGVVALADLLAGRASRRAVRTQRAFTARLLTHVFARPVAQAALVNGREVMARYRLEPGPMVGRLMGMVRRAQVENGISTKQEAWRLLDSALGGADD